MAGTADAGNAGGAHQPRSFLRWGGQIVAPEDGDYAIGLEGDDARFTVYEDDNETYAYEKGQRATYELAWNDARRVLTIGARQGRFPGMIERRTLNIVMADAAGGGIDPASPTTTVTYDGRPLSLTLPATAARQ